MKNRIQDVRDHLVAMMEALGEPDADDRVIERAKAVSMAAGAYVSTVKVELDALRLYSDTNMAPAVIDAPSAMRRLSAIK